MQTLTEGWSERALLRWPTASASAGAKSNTCCVPCVEDTAQSPLYVLRVVVRVVAEPRAKRVGTAQVEKYRRCLQQRNAHQQQALQPAGSIRRFWVMREQLVEASQRDYSLASWLLRIRHASRESSCQVRQCSVTSPTDALLCHHAAHTTASVPCSLQYLQALVLSCASDHYLDYQAICCKLNKLADSLAFVNSA